MTSHHHCRYVNSWSIRWKNVDGAWCSVDKLHEYVNERANDDTPESGWEITLVCTCGESVKPDPQTDGIPVVNVATTIRDLACKPMSNPCVLSTMIGG